MIQYVLKFLKNYSIIDKNNIGINYLRLTIGASDLDTILYSYDDLPEGQTDLNMTHFHLGYTLSHVIPILKQI